MNKKILLAVIGAAIALPFAAHAQKAPGQAYIGANVGSAKYKMDIDTIGKDDSTDTGFKLYGGTQINKYFGVEAGYGYFGKGKNFYGLNSSTETQSGYLAATGTAPISDKFSLFGKVGVAYHNTKWHVGSVSNTDHKTSAMYGVGAEYAMTPKVSVVAEYEYFGKVSEDGVLKLDMWSLGARYKF